MTDQQRSPCLPTERACRSGRAIVVFLAVATVAAGLDLWTKHAVFASMLETPGLAERVETLRLSNPDRADDPEFPHLVLQNVHLTRRVCWGLSLTLSTNSGVVFGFDAVPRWVVNVVTGVAIVLIAVFFATTDRRGTWMHVALALILGGAVGNLYDRLFSSVVLPGLPAIRRHVRDFIDCSDLHYDYIFNLADAWLVIGVVMVFLQWFADARRERAATAKGGRDNTDRREGD